MYNPIAAMIKAQMKMNPLAELQEERDRLQRALFRLQDDIQEAETLLSSMEQEASQLEYRLDLLDQTIEDFETETCEEIPLEIDDPGLDRRLDHYAELHGKKRFADVTPDDIRTWWI